MITYTTFTTIESTDSIKEYLDSLKEEQERKRRH